MVDVIAPLFVILICVLVVAAIATCAWIQAKRGTNGYKRVYDAPTV